MDVISYNENEIDSKMARSVSNLYKKFYKKAFDKNPTLTRYISKLSDIYVKYKETYNFPTKYKGMINLRMVIWLMSENSAYRMVEFKIAKELFIMLN